MYIKDDIFSYVEYNRNEYSAADLHILLNHPDAAVRSLVSISKNVDISHFKKMVHDNHIGVIKNAFLNGKDFPEFLTYVLTDYPDDEYVLAAFKNSNCVNSDHIKLALKHKNEYIREYANSIKDENDID